MKWHIYTKKDAPFEFEYHVSINSITEDELLAKFEIDKQEKIRLGDSCSLTEYITDKFDDLELADDFHEEDWSSELRDLIDNFFDFTTNGEFDINEKSTDYYNLYEKMVRYLKCDLKFNSGELISSFDCVFSSEGYKIKENEFYLHIPDFYCGNGDKEEANLAIRITEDFMESNKWNIGFFDKTGELVIDIASWAKENKLILHEIKPIIWFGLKDVVSNCWSITTETEDSFIENFWGEYYDGAMNFIFKAESGYFFYYTVGEYGLDYDSGLFDEIKANCPIDLNLPQAERNKSLFDLIKKVYEKESLKKSLEKAGYERASVVYESYVENRAEIICKGITEEDIETLEDLDNIYLRYYLSNGQPRPSYMKDHDWPNNMNQIFWDNYSSVNIDSSIFTINNCAEKMNLINSFFNDDEVWNALITGANQFIIDNYD